MTQTECWPKATINSTQLSMKQLQIVLTPNKKCAFNKFFFKFFKKSHVRIIMIVLFTLSFPPLESGTLLGNGWNPNCTFSGDL